jgi:hypothetical protein
MMPDKNLKNLKYLILISIVLSAFTYIITNSSEFIYATASNLPNTKVDTVNTKNVTILNASVASNNSLLPTALGSVSIKNLSQTPITTNFSNPMGLEPASEDTSSINLTEEKAAAALAITSFANNTEFSLDGLLNNTSNNSTSINETAYNANSVARSVSLEIPGGPLSSFTFPIESLARRSGFQGISFFDTGVYHHKTRGDGPSIVPDPQIAVSPSHVGEMVNVAGAFYTKDGQLLHNSPFQLEQFFKTGKDQITDPRIIYDNSTNRWFALIQDVTDNTIRLSVSAAGDPINSNWHPFKFPFGNVCPDQPSVGLSKDKLVISVNPVDDCIDPKTSYGVNLYIVDKSDLISGPTSPDSILVNITGSFSLIPAKMSNSNETSDLHLVQVVGSPIRCPGCAIANSISVVTLSGSVQDIKIETIPIPIQNLTAAEKAEQPGRQAKQSDVDIDPRIPNIDTSDARVLDASWHNGRLWLAAADLCKDGKHSCIRLIEVDTPNNTLIQDFDVSLSGKYLFYPALAIDSSGNLGIIFGLSSEDDYPSLYGATRSVNASNNTLSSIIPLILGLSTTNADSPNRGGIYGDYFGATIDPTSPNQFWVVGEFIPVSPLTIRNVFWSTFIANFTSSSVAERSLSAETTTAVKYDLSDPTNLLIEALPNHKNKEYLEVVR